MVISCFSQGFRACPSDLEGVYELRTFVWSTRFLCVAFLFGVGLESLEDETLLCRRFGQTQIINFSGMGMCSILPSNGFC